MSVTGEAFVTMAVRALTEENPAGKDSGQNVPLESHGREVKQGSWFSRIRLHGKSGFAWAQPYLDAAQNLGFTKDWDSKQLAQPLTRKDVALMLANIINDQD